MAKKSDLIISFKKDLRSFKDGEVINLGSGSVCLVGHNGSGKSTLMEIISAAAFLGKGENRESVPYQMRRLLEKVREHNRFGSTYKPEPNPDYSVQIKNLPTEKSYFFQSSESLNVRNSNDMDFILKRGLGLRMSSAGLSSFLDMSRSFLGAIKIGEEAIFILDEPESSLDLIRLMQIKHFIKMLLDYKVRVIMSTHSQELMSLFPNVFDVGSRKKVSASEYLEKSIKEAEEVTSHLIKSLKEVMDEQRHEHKHT